MVPADIPAGGSVKGGVIYAADGSMWGCCDGGNWCATAPSDPNNGLGPPKAQPSAAACTAGETQCEGAYKVKSCVGGRWKVVQNCKEHNQVCSFGMRDGSSAMGAFCTVADH
jgi:hypothetical protein